jgi:hypothetical protein
MPAFEAPHEVAPHTCFTWIFRHKSQLGWVAYLVGFAEGVTLGTSLLILVVGGLLTLAVLDGFVESPKKSRPDWQIVAFFVLSFLMLLATSVEAFWMFELIAVLMHKADEALGNACATGWLAAVVFCLLAGFLHVVSRRLIRRPATS